MVSSSRRRFAPGETVEERPLDDPVEPRVLERHDRLRRERRGGLDLVGVEGRGRDHERPEVGCTGAEWERDALAGSLGIADPYQLALAAPRPAVGTGRLDHVDDHPAGAGCVESRRAPRRTGQPRPEPGSAFGLELDEPLLELAPPCR